MRHPFCLIPVLALCLFASLPAFGQHLKQTPFEDGTGSVGLAPGWKIGSVYRGTVICNGPSGAAVSFGLPWAIQRPDTPLNQLPASHAMPKASVGDLPGALRAVISKMLHGRLVSLRSRPAPSSFPGIPAVYYLFQYEIGGKPFSGLGYYTTINPGYDSPDWLLYSSAVAAPSSQFNKLLPTMMAMWHSWRPNGQKPKAGSESAMVDDMIARRQATFSELQQKFDKIIIGD